MLRKTTTLTLVILLAMVALSAAAVAAPDMQPGQWAITTTMEIPGMPMKMPPMTIKQCLTKEDIIPKQSSNMGSMSKNSPCAVKNVATEGNKVIWDVECKGQRQQMQGHGEVTYHGTTMEGTVTVTVVIPGQGTRKMIMHMTGKRIGACEK